jgi:hypothetical protein
MERALAHITEMIKQYRALTDLTNGERLNYFLQQISGTLYYLETIRSEYHSKYQCRVNELILQGESVSRSENTAHKELPEMYMLRRVMDSAYTCIDAIRTHISWLKSEKNNL